jgi:hypothetical protein
MNSGALREIDIAVRKESRLADVRFYSNDSSTTGARTIATGK